MPGSGSRAALAVRRLAVSYGERRVLAGLDLVVPAGEIYGLLGPNGAGKTTLIRAICGRLGFDTGSIEIAGEPARQRRSLERIGLVPQEIALYSHLTVLENLETFGRLSGLSLSKTREAIAWTADAARLGGRLNDRIDILSGGWKRRVNIAAAILHRPALLILDEPTVGVDIEARHALEEIIHDLSHEGMGVLIATHDLDQVENLCDRVGFLRDGTIAPQGPPQRLLEMVFEGREEVIVELRDRPEKPQHDRLRALGFSPGVGATSWTRLEHPGQIVSKDLAAEIEAVGPAPREIRYRAPGLDSLFRHLIAEPSREAGP